MRVERRESRLVLRPIRPSEIEDGYLKWMQDPEVNRYLESRFRTWSLDELNAYVTRMESDENNFLFAISLRHEERHIGNTKLGPVDWVHRRAPMGIMIGDRGCRGRGYGVEAIGLVADYAFEHLRLNKITAGIYAVNKASINAFLKAGFTSEGVRRQHYIYDGEYIDSIEMGLLRSDWKSEA